MSIVVMVPFVVDTGGVAAADATGPASTIQLAAPAVLTASGYVASVTSPTPFVMPTVSDAAGDSFTYVVAGTNSAECVVATDGLSFTYEHSGTCVVQITATSTDDDGDADAVNKTNPSTCEENVSGNVRAHLRVARQSYARAADTKLNCTNVANSTSLTLTVLDQPRSIVVGAPATGTDGVYSASVTAPTPFTMPLVSDGVSSDTFSFTITGTNGAGCTISKDATTFSYQTYGSCTVEIAALTATSDTDGDPSTVSTDASATLTLTVLAHSQNIYLSSTTAPYHSTVVLQANGSLGSGLITYGLVGGTASGCVIDAANELSATTAGTCLVQARIAADSTYAAATSATATITFAPAPVVTPPRPPTPPVTTTTAPPVTTTTSPPPPVIKPQALSLASGHLPIGRSWHLRATGYLGTGAITYVLLGGTASGCVIDSSYLVHATVAGTCRVQAHITADGVYGAAASNVATIDFTVLDQSISLPSGHVKFGGSWQLRAAGYSGEGVVRYHLTGGTARGCVVNARDALTASSAGTCLVTASITAAGNYAAATSSVATVTFDPAPVLPTLVIKNSAVAAPPRPKLPPTVALSVASFAEGSYLLTPSLDAQINVIAATVVAKKYHVVDLTGYTDNVFTPAFNLTLNAQRTAAVRTQLLVDLAARHATRVRVMIVVNPKRYVFQSRSNVTPTGRAYNRRVVATLYAV